MEPNKNIDALTDTIKSAQTLAENAETKSVANGVAVEGLTDSLKAANNKVETLEKELTDTKTGFQTQLDDTKAEFKSLSSAKADEVKTDPFVEAVKTITENKDMLLKGQKLELDIKTVNYGSGEAANVPLEERIADIKVDPHFYNRVRNHIMIKPTSADVVRYNKRDTLNNPAGGKTKGSAFADYSPTLQNLEQTVITYGAITTINEEQLDDVLGLQSFLQNDLMGFVMDAEDVDILSGDDTSTEFAGFFTDGTTWVDQRAVGDSAIIGANNFDVLTHAVAQLAGNNFHAAKIFMNPSDFWGSDFALAKSTQGEYVLRQTMNEITPMFGGAQIVVTPAVAKDKFAVIDMGSVAYHLREGLQVEFYRNGTDFANNNISVRAKLRGCVTTYLPLGIIQGDFSDAKTELLAAQA